MFAMLIALSINSSWAQENESLTEEVAQETENTNEQEVLAAQVQSVTVRVKLANGVALVGVVPLSEVVMWAPGTEGTLTFRLNDANGEAMSIPNANIVSMEQVNIEKTPEPEPETQEKDPAPVQEEAPEVAVPQILNEDIPEGEFSFANPAASRYLYAPSSIGLQKGQGYASQKWIFTTGVYALSDNATILIGTTVPFPFATVVGGKLSKKLDDNWYVGAGAEVFFLPFASFNDGPQAPVTIGFVSTTYGDLDSHITVATGAIYEQVITDGDVLYPVMIAGHRRVADRLALVTENWILLDTELLQDGRSPYMGSISSLAFRLIGRRDQQFQIRGRMLADNGYPRYTWDIGLVMFNFTSSESLYDPVTGEDTTSKFSRNDFFGPLPWIDYTWHFGPATK